MKMWKVIEKCDNCGYEEAFVLIPSADKMHWTCPKCYTVRDVIADCGINADGLTVKEIEGKLEYMIGEPDEE